MSKKIDLRKVHKRKVYFVKELAVTLGVTIQAIYFRIHHRNLRVVIMHNVIRIKGRDFIDNEKQNRLTRKMVHNEIDFLCFHCRQYNPPKDNMVWINDFRESDKNVIAGTIQLIGFCPICGEPFYKFSNLGQMSKIRRLYTISNK